MTSLRNISVRLDTGPKYVLASYYCGDCLSRTRYDNHDRLLNDVGHYTHDDSFGPGEYELRVYQRGPCGYNEMHQHRHTWHID